MTTRTVKGLIATVSLAGVVSFIWFGRGAADDRNVSGQKAARDARRKAQIARFAQLRSAIRHLAQKESKEQKEERRRFQSILSSALGDTSAIVVNARKLKSSPIGNGAYACIANTQQSELDNVEQKWGVDLLEDASRIAFAKDFLLIAGQMAPDEKDNMLRDISWESYGVKGKVFDSERVPGSARSNLGLWGDKLFIASEDLDEIYDAIDIAEGWEVDDRTHGFQHSNGVVYGNMAPGKLIDLLDVSDDLATATPLLDRLVRRVNFELHIHQGVLVKTELVLYRKETKDVLIIGLESLRDILVRKSDYFGYEALSSLIDSVSVSGRGDAIILEWEMPLEFVKQELTRCSG
jgi:hypothetical protein